MADARERKQLLAWLQLLLKRQPTATFPDVDPSIVAEARALNSRTNSTKRHP